MEHVTVVENPDGGARDALTTWRQTAAKIKTAGDRGICNRPGVPPVRSGYIKTDALNADVIFYTEDDEGITAFLTATLDIPKKVMYTKLVCSDPTRGSGRPIIQRSLAYARSRGMTHASLNALPTVVDYYPKFGYVRNGSRPVVNAVVHGTPLIKNLSNLKNWGHGLRTPERIEPLPLRIKPMKKQTTGTRALLSIVWAHVPGHPWWPAQLQIPRPEHPKQLRKNDTIFVAFYGGDFAWVGRKDISTFKGKQGTHYEKAVRYTNTNPKKQPLLDAIDLADAAARRRL